MIPFYDRAGKFFAFQGRAFGKEVPKYITIKFDETKQKIFGLDRVDLNKPVMITEGPIDSLFLDNAIALAGADADGGITIQHQQCTMIYDNEPRNREIVNLLGKSIENGHKVCIWDSDVKEKDIKRARDRALEIIDFVDLIEKRHHFAKELSTGQRKRLEMARAMAIDPKLLLMDEVTGGVDQKTIPGLVELVKKLKKTGVTIITIEHNINIIMEISDNVLALDKGKGIAFGEPKEIQNNKQEIDAYLGTFDAA